jgi:uncharacterized membrane protein YeaQ/YmgE (transglycosylase-associated protein family)
MGIIAWIIAGLIAGWAAGKIMKGSGYGVLGDIALGILGGILGGLDHAPAGIRGQRRDDLQHHRGHYRGGDSSMAGEVD